MVKKIIPPSHDINIQYKNLVASLRTGTLSFNEFKIKKRELRNKYKDEYKLNF